MRHSSWKVLVCDVSRLEGSQQKVFEVMLCCTLLFISTKRKLHYLETSSVVNNRPVDLSVLHIIVIVTSDQSN